MSARFLGTTLLMFAVWIPLSGRLDAFHLSLGLLSSALVSRFSGDLLAAPPGSGGGVRLAARFLAYIPWLLWQIFLSSLHILYLTFHPRMKEIIDPRILRFRSALQGEVARVTFANSITLTPGTITVYVSLDGDFQVHAIDAQSADSLPGEMESRIAAVFGER
jgi:multicomponent Na+:H+ antiporter subunit E